MHGIFYEGRMNLALNQVNVDLRSENGLLRTDKSLQ